MFWAIASVLIAALIIYIAWKPIKTILHVAIIAVVLAAGLVLFGFHEFRLPKGITLHGQTVLASVEHSASNAANRIRHGLAAGHHPK